MRIAYQNTGCRDDAEDIVQEVFIKLMLKPPFQDEVYLKAWLIRVAINLCKDHKKSFWQRKVDAITEDYPAVSPEQGEIWHEVRKLGENYRNVIYLYFYEGYNIPEIAKILGRKENTVSSWLGRAKKKLKLILSEGGYEYE
jgi:RNA polymerase sigma-70 factor (ECF subfamily)